jgi:hypothetical protein
MLQQVSRITARSLNNVGGGKRFTLLHSRPHRPGGHPASSKMETDSDVFRRGSGGGAKRLGRGIDIQLHLAPSFSMHTPAPLPPSASSLACTGHFTFYNNHCALGVSFKKILLYSDGRDSSVSIGTDYGLDGPGIEYRWW